MYRLARNDYYQVTTDGAPRIPEHTTCRCTELQTIADLEPMYNCPFDKLQATLEYPYYLANAGIRRSREGNLSLRRKFDFH